MLPRVHIWQHTGVGSICGGGRRSPCPSRPLQRGCQHTRFRVCAGGLALVAVGRQPHQPIRLPMSPTGLLLPHCAIRLQCRGGRLCAHCGHHLQLHEAVHRPAPHKNRLQHVPRGQLRRRAGAPTGLAAHNGRGRVAYQPLRGLCTLLAGPLSPARMSAQHVELQVQARLPCVLTWIRPAAAQE